MNGYNVDVVRPQALQAAINSSSDVGSINLMGPTSDPLHLAGGAANLGGN